MFIRIILLGLMLVFLTQCLGRYSRDTQQIRPLEYQNEWAAMRNLDLKYLDSSDLKNEQIHFKNALSMILNANYDEAQEKIAKINRQTIDSTTKHYSNQVLTDLLFFQSDWEKIIKNYLRYTDDLDDEDNIMLSIMQFSNSPKEQLIWKSDSFNVHTIHSVSGSPLIEVVINGNPFWFWVDTGANYSVIASDAAQICNIQPLSFERSKALTATILKVNYMPAILDIVEIGDLEIRNHPAIILNDFDLRLRIFGSNRLTKIDGIIGWKLLQNLDITLDYVNSETIIRKPMDKDTLPKNFFWLGVPVLRVESPLGRELFFGIDTGSENTVITQNILEKLYFEDVYWITREELSAGGALYNFANVVRRLDLVIDGTPVHLEDVGTGVNLKDYFVKLDGIIGSDLLHNSILRLNCMNGYFSYQLSE